MEGLLALLTNSFISGALSPLFVRLGTQEFPLSVFTFLRFFIAVLVFFPIVLRFKKKFNWEKFPSLVFYSLFFSGNAIFFGLGLQYTSVLASQILYAAVPIFTGIFSYLIIHEKFSRYKIMGALISLSGVLFIIYQSAGASSVFSLGTPFGNIIILMGVVCWSLYLVFSKKITAVFTPIETSFTSYVVTLLISLFIIPFEYYLKPFDISQVTSVGVTSLIGVGVVSTAFSFYLIQYGVKKTSPFTASLFFYMGPFFSSLTAVPLLHEKLTFQLIIGGFLILLGVFFATSYEFIKRK